MRAIVRLRIVAPLIAIVSSLGSLTIAWAQGKEITKPCPAPGLVHVMDSWQPLFLTRASIAFRFPPAKGADVSINMDSERWIGSRGEVLFDVSADSTGAPFFGAGKLVRADSSMCSMIVAARPMRMVIFRDPNARLHAPYAFEATWPLEPGSWLRIGGVTADSMSRNELLAALRTLRLNSNADAVDSLHPRASCPPTRNNRPSARQWRLEYAPISLRTPETSRHAVFPKAKHESFGIDDLSLSYRVFRSPGWQLTRPADTTAIWCTEVIAGRRADIRIHHVMPEYLPGRVIAEMFLQLDPSSILYIAGMNTRDNPSAPLLFLETMRTLQLVR
jgi:hypothetical protein